MRSRLIRLRCASALCLLLGASVVSAQQLAPLPGDYGGAGLWQVPTARFGPDGSFTLGIVANSPYNRLFVTAQPFEWLEATFRYTDITNRLYSADASFSGDQSYKDRGIDLRVRLLEESDLFPALALGLRDLGGTQLFGAQYLVANRRYYDFDFSLGLGWGRLGSGGSISNPLGKDEQVEDSRGAGNLSLSNIFRSSNIGVFGGVTWETPIDGLQLAAEYDANDYENEPFDNTRRVRFPINAGLKYRLQSGLAAGLSYQRGSITSFQLSYGFGLASPTGVPKVLDPQPPASRALTRKQMLDKGEAQPDSSDPSGLALKVESALKKQRIGLNGFTIAPDGKSANVWIGSAPYRDTRKQIGRAARASSAVLPDSVLSLEVTEVVNGVETYDAEVFLPALERAATGSISTDEFQRAVEISSPSADKPEKQYAPAQYPQAGWSFNPSLRSSIGGPDNFYFGQLYLKLGGYLNFNPNWSVDGQLGFNIYNNFDSLKLESDSQLPRVRSDIKNYLKEGEQALLRLETNYIGQLSPTLYSRVSAGIFEEMYGGIASELLYRPADPRWAVGININRVRQRDFDQRFTFRDYEVTTGHLTGYFEFPRPSVLVKLSVGQYLAGDRGATLDVSRQFPNGIRIGAFATKTNVSAEQFGEGSFDKGIYLVFPLDTLLPRSTTGAGSFFFRPLTRDGGQMVRDGRSLYDITYGAVKSRIPLRDNLFFD